MCFGTRIARRHSTHSLGDFAGLFAEPRNFGLTNPETWLKRLVTLNVARTQRRGLAPHKPLLLLTVMDMIADRIVESPWIEYSPELFFRFSCYWELVYDRQQNRPDLRLPFHALGGKRDRIWERFTADHQRSVSKDTTRVCRMDESLWDALQDPRFRSRARSRLIAAYFDPREQIALCARLKLPEPTTDDIALIRQDAIEYKKSLAKGRDSGFRTAVLSGYQFTCALTGYRMCTEKEHLVEAAHIHQHAESGDDDPMNGLALTPDAHWMFDRGLWTVVYQGGGYVVRVANGMYSDASPTGRTLGSHDGMSPFFANATGLRPDPKRLAWHQRNVFIGR